MNESHSINHITLEFFLAQYQSILVPRATVFFGHVHFKTSSTGDENEYQSGKTYCEAFCASLALFAGSGKNTGCKANLVPRVFVPYCACWLDETIAGQRERRRWVRGWLQDRWWKDWRSDNETLQLQLISRSDWLIHCRQESIPRCSRQ